MHGSSTEDVMHAMILERQRLLIREANYLRGLVGLPPVDGVAIADDPDDRRRQPRLLDMNANRRAVVAAVARCVSAGEAPTYSTLVARSGVGPRAVSRVLAWAMAGGVFTRTERGYLPGPTWAECVDSDAELLGLQCDDELGTQGTPTDT